MFFPIILTIISLLSISTAVPTPTPSTSTIPQTPTKRQATGPADSQNTFNILCGSVGGELFYVGTDGLCGPLGTGLGAVTPADFHIVADGLLGETAHFVDMVVGGNTGDGPIL